MPTCNAHRKNESPCQNPVDERRRGCPVHCSALTKTKDVVTGKPRIDALTNERVTCSQSPMLNGSGRCKKHGGKSLSGTASPTYKHGRTSKFFIAAKKAGLARGYTEDLQDKESLHSFDDDLSILQQLQKQEIERFENGDGTAFRKALTRISVALDNSLRDKDSEGVQKHWASLKDLIDNGMASVNAVNEYKKTALLISKIRAEHHKAQVNISQKELNEQLQVIVTLMDSIINNYIDVSKQEAATHELYSAIHGRNGIPKSLPAYIDAEVEEDESFTN